MGMDVYGKHPKENRELKDFPVLYKYKKMEEDDGDDNIDGFKQKWDELDADHKLREQYWKEQTDYEEANPGYYFRNNCWWWRPLWNYCYHIAPDLIDDDLFENGHHNSGAGLGFLESKQLGIRLLKEIESGNTIKYQAEYKQRQEDTKDKDKWASSYPFDIDNVKEFANFCIESGGFEIC